MTRKISSVVLAKSKRPSCPHRGNPAGIQVPLTALTEKTWIPVYTGMTKHPEGLLADSFNSALESRDLDSEKRRR